MEKLRIREFKKLAFDKFTTSKCQIWAAALGSLMPETYLNDSITFSLYGPYQYISFNRGKQLQNERKAISSVCSFILISCWHDLKTENSLPMSSNLLSPWLCVLVHTASLVWLFLLTLHSSPLESSLGSSPISLPAPPLRRSSFSPYIVLVCVLSKQPALIPVIASVIWLNCLSFLIEGTVLHFRNLSVQHSVWPVVSMRKLLNRCLTQVFWSLCKTLWKPSHLTLIVVFMGDSVPFGSPGFLVNNKSFSYPWSLEVIDGRGGRECC